MVVEGEVLKDFLRFVSVLIAEFAVDGAVNLALKIKGDMIIKILDLKPTIDAMMRDFLEVLRSFPVERIERFLCIEVTKLTTEGRLRPRYSLRSYCSSRWKELSKELGSKILPCGDGSCWKAFKPNW
ncbi:hypothetical protein Tco_1473793 [Tanacetum coccineum]